MLFGFCFFKHWILFTHKIINFKSVHEITSLSCFLLFAICYLTLGYLIQNMFDFMDKHN